MATVAASPTYAGSHTGEPTGVWSWLTTVDHKRIGVLYLYTSLFFFLFGRSEEHTSELQSLMRISYAVFCLKKKTQKKIEHNSTTELRYNTTHIRNPHKI